MRLERIDTIFDFEKGTLQSTKCEPGDFDFITASREWKTHKEFTHDKEALVIAVAASGSLGRTHYVNGKFIASDLCFILTPKSEHADKLSLPFYQFVFNGLKEDLVKKCATGTAKQAINQQNFSSYRIPCFEPGEQDRMALRLKTAFASQESLENEITQQQSLLAKLKQAILQEAIQGKLTADWRAAHPDVEPASQLLHRIQAEKARLIAGKKLRPEKPLPKITATEIPFEIPNNWDWCRFGDVIRAYEAGSSFKCEDREVSGNEWGVIKTSAVTSGTFIENENKFLCADKPIDISAKVNTGDLVFCRASGSKGLAGKCVIVRDCTLNLLLSDKTIRIPLMNDVNQEYIAIHNDSTQSKTFFNCLSTGKSTSMNNITREELFKKPIPLPPLAEQEEIVKRVEALMSKCRALETEIEQARTNAANLLQVVLKEAFAPALK